MVLEKRVPGGMCPVTHCIIVDEALYASSMGSRVGAQLANLLIAHFFFLIHLSISALT